MPQTSCTEVSDTKFNPYVHIHVRFLTDLTPDNVLFNDVTSFWLTIRMFLDQSP